MKSLTQGEREFLNFLASRSSSGLLEVPLRELARELGISHPAILKKVKSLAAKGVVDYQKGRGRVPSRIIIKASWDADEVTKTADGYQNPDIRVTRAQEASPSEGYQKADTGVTKTSASGGYQKNDTEAARESSAVTKTEGYQKSGTKVSKKDDTAAGGMVTKTLDACGRSGEAQHDEARRAVIRWLRMGGPPDAREIAAAVDLPVSAVEWALAEVRGSPEKKDAPGGNVSDSADTKLREGVAPSAAEATSAKPAAPATAENEKVLDSGSQNRERLKTLIYHLKKLTESNSVVLKTELLHIYLMQGLSEDDLDEDFAVLERKGLAERLNGRRWVWRGSRRGYQNSGDK
jgi:DNA-binding transcriptional ArsR family regulator